MPLPSGLRSTVRRRRTAALPGLLPVGDQMRRPVDQLPMRPQKPAAAVADLLDEAWAFKSCETQHIPDQPF